jgi:hypothetical protein
VTWRRLQAEALLAGDAGDHARRSVVRRAYLYLALFAGVIGGMISAVSLVFELVNSALSGQRDSSFVTTILDNLQLLILFAILLVYHLGVMRRDGRSAAAALAGRQRAFKLLVVDSGKDFVSAVRSALARVAPNVPVTVSARQPRGKFDAMIVSGSPAGRSQWCAGSAASASLFRNAAEGLHWAGVVMRTPSTSRRSPCASWPKVRRPQPRRSGWMVIVYIAALFGLELIMMLFGTRGLNLLD